MLVLSFFVISIIVILVIIIIYLFASEGFQTQALERETCTILLALTENPATRWMCVKKRKWQKGRQSGCQGEVAPCANAQPDPSVSVFSCVPAGSRFRSSGSFT